ncbi:MAG: 3-oxoacyl-ACP synthase [Actinomycetota bacterium]
MTRIGLAATAGYLPERWMTAAEIGEASGIPEKTLVEKFGLRGKHIAAAGEHVSDMAVEAGTRLIAECGVDPGEIDAVVYYGSTWKDYPVWHAAPWIAHRLGCRNAFALELDYVSCGTPVAIRVCRDLLLAEDDIHKVLAVAACRESYIVDLTNDRSRFAFNFGDGAVAGLLVKDHPTNELLGCHMITDGSFAMDVVMPAGGSVEPPSHASVDASRHFVDVPNPRAMKERLDLVSLPNFLGVAEGALKKSGATVADISCLCLIHMKRSMHEGIVQALGVDPARAPYLDDTGHMSGADPLFSVDRAARAGMLSDGDMVLMLGAGAGYTWAASVLRWGSGE